MEITSTIEKYNKINEDLVILKQNSSYWYAQIKTPPELGYSSNRQRQSTGYKIGTRESFIKAVAFGEKVIKDNNLLAKAGTPLFSFKPTVKQIALKVIKEIENSNQHNDTKNRKLNLLKNKIIPILGDVTINKLGIRKIYEYFERQKINSKTQLSYVKASIDSIYVYALKHEMITNADRPLWKDIKLDKIKASKRKTFRQVDIEEIHSNINTFIQSSTNKKVKTNRILFDYYTKFLEKTGLRAGEEIEGIKWKHIFQTNFKNNKRVTITLNKGKKGTQNQDREIHLSNENHTLLTKLYFRKFHGTKEMIFLLKHTKNIPLDEFMTLKKDHGDEYVFARSDGKTPDFCAIWSQYRKLLKNELTDENFTLYSFRHYFITKKLYQDIDVYKLAKYAGTSTEMISKYYDGSFSALASEFVIEDLSQENLNIF